MNLIGLSGYIGSGKDTVAKMLNYYLYKRAIESGEDTGLLYSLKDFPNYKWTFENKKFADKLKETAGLLLGVDRSKFESQDFKNQELSKEWWYWQIINAKNNADKVPYVGNENFDLTDLTVKLEKPTVRDLLQRIGTEAMRNEIHNDVWVNALFADYKPYIKNYPNLIKSNGKDLIEGNTYSMGKAINPNWIITDVRFPNELKTIKSKGGIVVRINRPDVKESFQLKNRNGSISNARLHPSETALDNYNTWDYVITNNGTEDDLYNKVVTMCEFFEL